MNELIPKFFQDELTGDEEQALSELLRNSVESALDFGDMAAQAYARSGLPEPKWPDKGVSSPPHFKWPKLTILGILAMVATLSGYFWHRFKTPINLSSSNPTGPSLPGQTSANSGEPTPIPIPEQGFQDHRKKAEVTKTALGPIPPLAKETSKTAFKVKILVRQPAYGPVTVQVLDSHDQKVRLLYDGFLNPGRWSFEWDGRLNSGAFAGPGKYQIQVLTGKTLQKQEVLIKPLKKH